MKKIYNIIFLMCFYFFITNLDCSIYGNFFNDSLVLIVTMKHLKEWEFGFLFDILASLLLIFLLYFFFFVLLG